MARKIDSTVGNAAADLARARLPGQRRVTMIVHDEQDEATLAELRRAIETAEATEEVEAEQAFAELRANLSRRHPASS
jgi:hypothetical protein